MGDFDITTKTAKRLSAVVHRVATRPAELRIDGAPVGGDSLDCAFNLTAGALFTADADAARRLLPSPRLHPVRVTPGRTLVVIAANDWHWRLGSSPPVRSVDVQVGVVVSYGRRSARTVVPVLLGGTPLGARYGVGWYWLTWFTTNRVTREVFSRMLGVDAALADAHEERRPDRTRFALTDSGTSILDLEVRLGSSARIPTMRPGELEAYRTYSVRDGELIGWAVTCHDVGSTFHTGPHRASLTLGDHPACDVLRSLDLSPRSFGGSIRVSGGEYYEGPAHLGRATPRPTITAADATITKRLVVSEEPGQETLIEQLPPDLPFDPSGTFTLEQRNPLPEGRNTLAHKRARD